MAYRKEIAVVLLMALLLFGAWKLLGGVSAGNDGAQRQLVEDAVRSAALTCFAVEGAYPANLEYLRDNYGLAYDASRYLVDFKPQLDTAKMPDIFVVEVEADS